MSETYLTPEGAARLKAELEELTTTKRAEIRDRLRDAIKMGDLSENADYIMAKEQQAFLEGRILELQAILRNATIVNNGGGGTDVVSVGNRVTVQAPGEDPETFTLVGAGIFALTRFRKPIVPQEALIGIVYAVAAAAAILVLSRAPEGGEELKALLVGHLLFVDWPEIIKVLVLYSAVGLIHWLARKPLLAISQGPERAFASGLRVRWWDFLFYATFGFVVTSSVEMAGVLLVFSFLIVPAVCGVLLARSIGTRLLVGWVVGTLTSVAGAVASYVWDLPTGATVVCAFGVSLALCGVLRRWIQAG